MLRLGITHALILLTCWAATAKAEGWDDFANNLATDLAPLLALFGKQVTKKFLSESITTLDNFIFAMAPLGIITAVVSAIRVCGAPSLRAFIGRANEGGGIAEAELCSSTSRDILEIVHDSEGADFGAHGDRQTPPTCGIYPFREYIKTARAKAAGWEELGRRARRSGIEDAESQKDSTKKQKSESVDGDEDDKFAANPNLSINIGIRKRPRHIIRLAAIVGFLAQASVLVVAFLVTYTWAWPKEDSLPPSWAFPLMSLGTVLLYTGMFLCALLVERSTIERVFRRSGGGPVTLHVVQPGNQIIGDQTFDSFSVAASLKEYTTSWKIPQNHPGGRGRASSGRGKPSNRCSDRQSLLRRKLDQLTQLVSQHGVWLATGATMAGFVLQFVGLRALHSVISVVQLGAILLMSIIRALLRTQRLPNEQNRLRDRPNEVEGHELDWLALHMGKSSKEPGVEDQGSRSWSVIPQPPNAESDSNTQPQDPPMAERTFYYRSRLAELTNQPKGVESKSSTAWGERFVHARQWARQLKMAIESGTQHLVVRAQVNAWQGPWTVDVVEHDPKFSPWQLVSTARLCLYVPDNGLDSKQPWIWDVNQHNLEAVVGLWTWSMISDPRTEKVDRFGLRASRASEIPAYRIVAAGATAEDMERAKTEMNFWSDASPSYYTTMRWTAIPGPMERGPHTLLWRTIDDEISTIASPRAPKQPNLRLYGWPVLSDILKPFVLVTMIDGHSLFATCAQEIFQSFVCATAAALDPAGGKTRLIKGSRRFYMASSMVSGLTDAFEQNGLGSKQDAYSVVVPALGLGSKMPLPLDNLPVIHSEAEETRNAGDFPAAEDVLRAAWDERRSAETLVELGELYRRALVSKDESMELFGLSGIDWMEAESFRDGSSAVRDICNRYIGLLRHRDNPNSNRHPTAQHVIAAISRNNRTDCLWLISQVEKVSTADARGRTVLSWAAQRGWLEVVKTALDIGSAVDSEDDAKRTPLSYAAEHGHAGVVRLLMEKGALPITEDSLRRTPLSYAAAEGRVRVMEALLGDSRVSVHTKDDDGRSPLHWAAKRGHEDAAELLLRRSPRIDDPDADGLAPLMLALLNRRVRVAEKLVANGAKFDLRVKGTEAWRWAIQHGEWTYAASLLRFANRERVRKRTVSVEVFPRSSQAKPLSGLLEAAPETELVLFVCSEDGTPIDITMETVRRLASEDRYDVVSWVCEDGDVHQAEELDCDFEARFKLVGLLLDHFGLVEDFKVPVDVVKAAAENATPEVMRVLLTDLGERVRITQDVFKAATGNDICGEEMPRLLLRERGKGIKITEDIVKVAAEQPFGEQVISLLLAERGKEVKVTEEIVKAAARNRRRGEQVMKLLLDRRAEVVAVEKVMETIAREFGEPVMRRMLAEQKEDMELEVTEENANVAEGRPSSE